MDFEALTAPLPRRCGNCEHWGPIAQRSVASVAKACRDPESGLAVTMAEHSCPCWTPVLQFKQAELGHQPENPLPSPVGCSAVFSKRRLACAFFSHRRLVTVHPSWLDRGALLVVTRCARCGTLLDWKKKGGRHG
jgi:hypothetical protein